MCILSSEFIPLTRAVKLRASQGVWGQGMGVYGGGRGGMGRMEPMDDNVFMPEAKQLDI